MKNRFLSLGIMACIAVSCGDSTKECVLGKPQAIFSPDMAGIIQHHFERAEQESLEEIVLERGVYVAVHQSGCDKLKQEFQFKVQGDYATVADSMWFKEAVRQFYHLGNLSEKTAALKMWASAIEAARSEMRLAEPKQVEEGIYVQVDKIVGAEESTLRVILLQQ